MEAFEEIVSYFDLGHFEWIFVLLFDSNVFGDSGQRAWVQYREFDGVMRS